MKAAACSIVRGCFVELENVSIGPETSKQKWKWSKMSEKSRNQIKKIKKGCESGKIGIVCA
jgi:hypothetical protein